MAKKTRGRPKLASGGKDERLELRMEHAEKQAFSTAAHLAGLALSAWIRTRLRAAAQLELREGRLPVPFLAKPDSQ